MVRFMRATDEETGLNLFTVDFMLWEEFRDAMTVKRSDKEAWGRFSHAHCLIGGVDIHLSYM